MDTYENPYKALIADQLERERKSLKRQILFVGTSLAIPLLWVTWILVTPLGRVPHFYPSDWWGPVAIFAGLSLNLGLRVVRLVRLNRRSV